MLFFRELVLFWESETAHDEKSPMENMFGKIARLHRFFMKIPDPKTGVPFPDRATPLALLSFATQKRTIAFCNPA